MPRLASALKQKTHTPMKHFQHASIALVFGLLSSFCFAQQNTPAGLWQSYSDKDGLPQAQIQISEKNGHYFGRIAKVVDITAKPGDICDKCTDERKNQPMATLEIIRDVSLQAEGDAYKGGRILDPQEGKEYRLTLIVREAGKKLGVRGYWGPFYRTQTWVRIK